MRVSVYLRLAGTTQAMLSFDHWSPESEDRFAGSDRVFSSMSALFWIRGSVDVTHDEIDRRISAGLARNIPTVTAFEHWICRILRRFGERSPVVSFPDAAGRFLRPVYPGGILRHRVRRFQDWGRDCPRRGRTRRDRRFQQHVARFCEAGA